jgi:hypothetical protein
MDTSNQTPAGIKDLIDQRREQVKKLYNEGKKYTHRDEIKHLLEEIDILWAQLKSRNSN